MKDVPTHYSFLLPRKSPKPQPQHRHTPACDVRLFHIATRIASHLLRGAASFPLQEAVQIAMPHDTPTGLGPLPVPHTVGTGTYKIAQELRSPPGSRPRRAGRTGGHGSGAASACQREADGREAGAAPEHQKSANVLSVDTCPACPSESPKTQGAGASAERSVRALSVPPRPFFLRPPQSLFPKEPQPHSKCYDRLQRVHVYGKEQGRREGEKRGNRRSGDGGEGGRIGPPPPK